jgi:pimeloyl-ACP methyl ester carboxylesterase
VDIGGCRLHLNCAGVGSPLIILDAGLGDSNLVWADIQPRLAEITRVCSYDRAGIGWSDPGQKPRTYQRAAEELNALLLQADEIPPFVLVGHSAGANTMRLFAHTYPEKVGGMLLIEPPVLKSANPLLLALLRLLRYGVGVLAELGVIRYLGRTSRMRVLFAGANPPAALSEQAGFLYRWESIQASIDEINGLPETVRLLNQSLYAGAWRDWPVTVISAIRGRKPNPALSAAMQNLAQHSSNGRLVQVESSHFVHFEQPDLVVSCIRELVGEIRKKT